MSESHGASHFAQLFARAQRRLEHRPGGIRDMLLELEGPPLTAQSRMIFCDDVTLIRGDNRASADMVLQHDQTGPMVAVHVPLDGSARTTMDGLGVLAARVGELQLFATPRARSTVELDAGVTNAAFRITITPGRIAALAARHPPLESLATAIAAARPVATSPTPAPPRGHLLAEVDELIDSEHYGSLRPLFLESRALGWLARALARHADADAGRQLESSRTVALPTREVARMHEARDLLLGRMADPPTLAMLAAAVGTNEFTLKRHFKTVFGEPVYAFLLRRRMAHARDLLRDTERSIKDIASEVGYAHANHFASAFRRCFSVSPRRYRASLRGRT